MTALETLWKAFDETGAGSFFLSWPWIGSWLRSRPRSANVVLLKALCGRETVGLALLTQKSGTLRGIVPVRQAWLNSTGDFRHDCIHIEYNGFASRLPWQELWPGLRQWFETEMKSIDELILPGMSWPLPRRRDGLLDLNHSEFGYRTPLSQIGEDGIAPLLSRNARHQLRRAMRICERAGPLAVTVARDEVTALEYFGQMKDLHVPSWTRRRKRHAFHNPFFEQFHRELIVAAMPRRSVDLLRISAGDRVLGYLYNFRRNGIVYSYQSGFDDAAAGTRPGYICHALAIAHYAAEGMCYYDFLAGSNRLKQSFGIERYELCWRRLRQPRFWFRAEAFLRRALGAHQKQES